MNHSQTPTLEIPSSQSENQHADRLRAILNVCKRMTSVGDVISLLELITIETKALLKADRVSIFLLDREKCELWSVISQEKRIMRLDARLGIAGSVAMTGQTINVADAYEHPLFYKELDLQTGYRTRTLLAVPLRDLKGEIIGVGEAINKSEGMFTDEDAEMLQTLAAHVSDTIETTQLERQLQDYPLEKESDRRPDIGSGFSTQNIMGMSYRIQSIIRLIDQIRDCSVDVLIEGESGTGKELVAKALHHSSPRAKHPFVAVNCAALPDNLVEAELFGIEKGVATGVDRRIGKFEEAHGGTLFLDEIGDLSLPAQAKILRVLQERSVDRVGGRGSVPLDVRIIAATNQNLEAAIREHTFREDLYYRLKVIHIQNVIASRCSGRYPRIGQSLLVQVLQDDERGAEAIYHRSLGGTVELLVARQRAPTRKRNQTPGRFRSRKIDNRRSFGQFHPKSERFHSKLPAESGTGAEVADVSILTSRRRAVRTPANRRGTAKFWWKQTKSGSSAGPEPPGVDQEVEALGCQLVVWPRSRNFCFGNFRTNSPIFFNRGRDTFVLQPLNRS